MRNIGCEGENDPMIPMHANIDQNDIQPGVDDSATVVSALHTRSGFVTPVDSTTNIPSRQVSETIGPQDGDGSENNRAEVFCTLCADTFSRSCDWE